MPFQVWWRIKNRPILPDYLLIVQKAGRIYEAKYESNNIHINDIHEISS
jgi:hypothetical protein